MGVEYQRWLIPKGNVFSPSGAAVAKLVERLRKERWISDPRSPGFSKLRFEARRDKHAAKTGAYAVRTIENDLGGDANAKVEASTEGVPVPLTAAWLDEPDREEARLVWPIAAGGADVGLLYPLSRAPEAPDYTLEIHRATEFVYPAAPTIDAIPTACACGEDLAFEWDEEEVVPAFVSATGIFAECEACGRTFDPSKGSATIRNPLGGKEESVRGGAAYRFALMVDCGQSFVSDPLLAFDPALVALVEDEFGRSFYEVGATY